MLTALLIMALLGGGSMEVFPPDDFRSVDSAIEEAERLVAASAVMERVNNRSNALFKQREQYLEQLSKVDAAVDARLEIYNEILNQLWQRRREASDGYVRDVFELRQHITRDEWAAIFDPPDPEDES